jgi:hypothetical protein
MHVLLAFFMSMLFIPGRERSIIIPTELIFCGCGGLKAIQVLLQAVGLHLLWTGFASHQWQTKTPSVFLIQPMSLDVPTSFRHSLPENVT